ncbi:CpaF family protein [Candidatus Micrarchaeota archaeon]|nr:CpaF family protein [Candidatus Micrarchaeota archaeon]
MVEGNWRITGQKTAYQVASEQLNAKELELSNTLVELQKLSSQKTISQLLEEYCRSHRLILEKTRAAKILKYLESEISGHGVLDAFLRDDAIEEIAILGEKQPVFVYVAGEGWQKTNVQFESSQAIINSVNKMSRGIGRRVSYQYPRLNAVLETGERIHATIPPVNKRVEVTIRKFKKNPISPMQLFPSIYSSKSLAFFWMLLQSSSSMLVCVNTGSGKTTTLNALFSFVPLNERVVVVEETPELNIFQEHCVKIIANKELSITLSNLVEDTLRMRPDRVIVGEVRNAEEAQALGECLLAGQARGTYATIHATDGVQALNRLKRLGLTAEELSELDLVIVQRRVNQVKNGVSVEKRVCSQVYSPKEQKMVFQNDGGGLKPTRDAIKVLQSIAESTFPGLDLEKELEKRCNFLEKHKTSSSYADCLQAISSYR